jgi:transposase
MITRFFGMDIHQDFAMVEAVNASQEVVYPTRRITTRKLARWAATELTSEDAVVIEVTTNAWHTVDVLERHAGKVVVANPYKTRLIAEAQIKNDKVDADALARLLAANFICEVWVPSAEVRQWRILAQHRANLCQQCTRIKKRLHSLRHRHNLTSKVKNLFSRAGIEWWQQQPWPASEALIVTQLLAQLELLEAQLHDTQQRIARLAAQDPRVMRLLQISGIGLYTAFTIVAVLGDVARFPSPSKLCSYIGLVPRQHQSGRRGYFGHITKAGTHLLRWLLVEAAQAAVRWDPHWQEIHSRIARRRGSAIATVAVARKLLVTVWHMLSQQSTYRYLRQQAYITKLQNWAYSIGRQHLAFSSSKNFVSHCLRLVDLSSLADQLFSQKGSGRLRLLSPSS